MSTTHLNTSTRPRFIKAAAVLVTTGAIAAGGMGTAASADARPPDPRPPAPSIPAGPGVGPGGPANSAKNYGAMAYSPNTGVWAATTGPWSSIPAAFSVVILACQNAGGGKCVDAGSADGGCVALAVGEDNAVDLNRWQSRRGATKMEALIAAIDANGGGQIATSTCAGPAAAAPYQTYTGRVGRPRF